MRSGYANLPEPLSRPGHSDRELLDFLTNDSPMRIALPELASDGGLVIFMSWYFHSGLEPHLQRAHAGHTLNVAPNP
jgi:hypothetical protein